MSGKSIIIHDEIHFDNHFVFIATSTVRYFCACIIWCTCSAFINTNSYCYNQAMYLIMQFSCLP